MIISSLVGTQPPLLIVHLRVALAPIANPVTPEAGLFGAVILAVPATTVQVPVPEVGVLPFNVVLVVLHKL